MSATIVWLRRDLRLADHPALTAAVQRGQPVVAVYVDSPDHEGDWPVGAAGQWWLHHSLQSLDAALRQRGSCLIVRAGHPADELGSIARAVKADEVLFSRRYEPQASASDQRIIRSLEADGLRVRTFNASLLFEPWEIERVGGGPYQVFTAFWKQCLHRPEAADCLAVPERIPAPDHWPRSVPLDSLELLPKTDWAAGIREAWTPGEPAAEKALGRFLEDAIGEYTDGRDRPDVFGTSRLSPHLHWGEISPRRVWHVVRQYSTRHRGVSNSAEVFLRELGWREFAHHLLHHFPDTPEHPLREAWHRFPWSEDKEALGAWQRGMTGYPIVDAGMRELWHTGWMHNRVRMIVASFLTKDLLIAWQAGARWFWETLVDGDLANNTFGWQWTAGCGADAAPYFRIFNPVIQGQRFDPTGDYVRRWVPEIAGLPDRVIHDPPRASGSVLEEAGVVPGETYPYPIVDHGEARQRALKAYELVKGK